MSKKHKNKSGYNRGAIRWIIILVILVAATGVLYVFTRSDKTAISPEASSLEEIDRAVPSPGSKMNELKGETQKSVTRAVAGEIKSDTLIGQWFRTDGEYMIQVSEISDDGQVKAQYFNPRPINVSNAEAYFEQPPRLFIELQDAGYDGSNYNLTYDIQNDVLRGNYYQATYGQTYAVIFMRGTSQ